MFMESTRPINLGAVHDDFATLRPDRTAFIDGESDVVVTYRELSERIAKAGNALDELGAKKGDRIALFFPNELTYVYTFFGAMRIGAVPVPINVESPSSTVRYVVEDSDAALLVSSDDEDVLETAANAASAVDAVETLAVDAESPASIDAGETDVRSYLTRVRNASPVREIEPVDADDPALQPYTSGSTGQPKGVVLDHEGAWWNIDAVRQTMMYDETTRGIVAAPLYHKNAMVAAIKPLLSCGGSTVVMQGFDTEAVLRAIDEHRVTLLIGVPAMYQMLLEDTESLRRYDVSSVSLARCGSDTVPETLMDRFEDVFEAPLLEMYGITEGGPGVLCNPRWGGPRKLGSAGLPYPGVDTRIVDPETGSECPPNETGELLISNPGLGSYYELPEKEKTAFEERDGKRFLHTEDIAYIDEDGYHYIVGRLDNMMIVGGENVYPAEVETLLEEHDAVDDVVVVSAPHAVKGEAPVAFVVSGDEITESELKQFAIDNGPAYAHPRRVFFVEGFPLTGAGKVDRTTLEAEATDRIGELQGGR